MGNQACFLAQQHVPRPGCPGQPDGEVVAEPPQLIVPATRAQTDRVIGEVGVLVAHQIPDQFRGDLKLGVGHADQR